MAREELSVVEDIQDSSYRRTVTGHRWLVDIRRFPATAIVRTYHSDSEMSRWYTGASSSVYHRDIFDPPERSPGVCDSTSLPEQLSGMSTRIL